MFDFLQLLEKSEEFLTQAQETIEQAQKLEFTGAAERLQPVIEQLIQAGTVLREKKLALLHALTALTVKIDLYDFETSGSFFCVYATRVAEYRNKAHTEVINRYTLESFTSYRWKRDPSTPHKFYALCSTMMHAVSEFIESTSRDQAEGLVKLGDLHRQLVALTKRKGE